MKKITLLLLFSAFLLTSCKEKPPEIVHKYYNTALVSSGSIIDSESYIGYTESFNNVTLSAKAGGKIISLSKNIGDMVKVGEIVAILDSNEAKTGVQSSNDIIKSLEKLKLSTTQMYDSQMKVMQEKIKSAKTGIEIAQVGVNGTEAGTQDTKNITLNQIKTVETQISSAQTQRENIQLQEENAKITLEQKEGEIYSNSKNALSQANIYGNNVIDFLDNILGITQGNKYKNDSFEMYIGVKDSTGKNEIENNFRDLYSKYNQIKNLPISSNEEIESTLKIYHDFFANDMRNILKKSYTLMENSISSASFGESNIMGYKTQITALQNQNEQILLTVSGNYFLGLKGSIDSISSFKKEKKATLDTLNKQIESATKQIDTLEQTLHQISSMGDGQLTDMTTKNQISKKQQEVSQNSLSEAMAGLEAIETQKKASLSEIDAQIQQVIAGKKDAGVMIENGKVISLISGVITKKMAEIGNTFGPGMPIMVVSTKEKIKVEVEVSQDILNKIHIGNKAQVEIEGVGEIKTGIITKILPLKDMMTKKTSIEITLENKKDDIKIGSYSKVFFDIQANNNAIIIPNNAIVSKFMIPQVFVLQDHKALLKHITIQKQNDNFSQIEGLEIGNIIITQGKENISDGEILP